jgi:hypothetical protein
MDFIILEDAEGTEQPLSCFERSAMSQENKILFTAKVTMSVSHSGQ